MAEEEIEKEDLPQPPQRPPPFLEVVCKSSGSVRRFATGTEAGFAVSLINRKLGFGVPLVSHIEAVKEGEEPVSFGPNSVLVSYGDCWKLQTVMDEEGHEKEKGTQPAPKQFPTVTIPDGLHPVDRSPKVSEQESTFLYFGRILLAFILMFVLGTMFTLVLENLPRIILFINSSM